MTYQELINKYASTFRICDSYRVMSRKEMRCQLEAHRMINPLNNALNKRSINSLIREWCAHNLLYRLHIARSHTESVDFEYPQRWYYTAIWWILSVFYYG